MMTTTTTRTTNQLISAEERERLQSTILPVYCHYGGQARPQDAYIVIDPEREEGQVYAEHSREPGSAVTLRYFYGREAHIKLSPCAYGPDILEFIDSHAAEFLAIIDDYRCVWDDRDGELVGRWGETARRLLPRLRWAARCNIRTFGILLKGGVFMPKYTLNSSMTDRINFDEAVARYLDEWLAVTGSDANLLPSTIEGLREQFLDGLDVDNMEEAEARFNRIVAEFAAAVAAAK